MKNYGFGHESRMGLDRDIEQVIRNGHRVKEDFLVLFWRRRESLPTKNIGKPTQRIAIKISSRVANAVRRNRIKRWIREIFRVERVHWTKNIDIVIIVKPFESVKNMTYPLLKEKLFSCFQKAHIASQS